MRIYDYRHHAPEDPPDRKAALLLEKLAEKACAYKSHFDGRLGVGRRHPPDSFQGRPGAMIQERPPEERELLGHLTSDHEAKCPLELRYERHLGHKWNPVGGILEWSPPSIWKLGH